MFLTDSTVRMIRAIAVSLRESGVSAHIVETALTDAMTDDVRHRAEEFAGYLLASAKKDVDCIMVETYYSADGPTANPGPGKTGRFIRSRTARQANGMDETRPVCSRCQCLKEDCECGSARRNGIPGKGWDVIEAGGGWDGPPADPPIMP